MSPHTIGLGLGTGVGWTGVNVLQTVAPLAHQETVLATPFFIHAERLGNKLTVYASTALDRNHEFYVPVNEALNRQCTKQALRVEVQDEAMMWGEAVLTQYELLDYCPGEGESHRCVQD